MIRYTAVVVSRNTVSDNIVTGELTSAEERQTSFTQMMELALETAIKL
jgi:purine-nucleoside phosphorylase